MSLWPKIAVLRMPLGLSGIAEIGAMEVMRL